MSQSITKHPGVHNHLNFPDTPSCTCAECVSACHNAPGWMSPVEALKAIRSGRHGDLMQAQWWTKGCDISILCPATYGNRGKRTPWVNHGTCVLLKDNLCSIHTTDYKPIECRKVRPCDKNTTFASRELIANMWNSFVGKYVNTQWEIFCDKDRWRINQANGQDDDYSHRTLMHKAGNAIPEQRTY